MPRSLRERPVLSPPGDAAVDKAWVPSQADVRSQSQTLHDARTEALDQRVRMIDDTEQSLGGAGLLQVDGQRAPPALGRSLTSFSQKFDIVGAMSAIHTDHLGAHVGKIGRAHV